MTNLLQLKSGGVINLDYLVGLREEQGKNYVVLVTGLEIQVDLEDVEQLQGCCEKFVEY